MSEPTIDKSLTEQEKKEQDLRAAAIEQFTTDAERDIYAKMKRILEHFRDNIFPEQYEIIKSKKLFSKEYEAQIKRLWLEYKSAKIYPLIQTIHDTFLASLFDNDLKPKIYPLEDADPAEAEKAERFFLWWVELADADQCQEIIRSEASLIWASYWIPGYATSTVKIDWEDTRVFIPALYPVSFFELFYSIGARDFYKAPEKFRRRFMSFKDLEKTYYPIWNDMEAEVTRKQDAILYYPNPLSEADFTKIYDIDAYAQTYIQNFINGGYAVDGMVYDNTFNVLKTSDYVEVVELYIWTQLMVMVNWYFVYSWNSPFYYWEDVDLSVEWPFIEITYEKWIGSLPRGIWHKIMPHQKQCNSLFNSISDAVYKSLNPMYWTIQWSLYDPISGESPTSIKYVEWWTLTLNPWMWGNPLWKLDFIDYNVLQIAVNQLNNLKEDAYTVCWVNSYTMWWEWKVERTRAWVDQRIATAKARLAPIMASIWRFYTKLFYHWINLAVKSGAKMAFIETEDWTTEAINIDDINKRFKIVCTSSNSAEEARAQKLDSLVKVMQQTAPLVTNEITGTGEIDKRALLNSIIQTVWLDGFEAFTTESYKKYIDDSYEIKKYMAEKEMEVQQVVQQWQPQQAQPEQGMPMDQQAQMQWMPMQWQPIQPPMWQEEAPDYII